MIDEILINGPINIIRMEGYVNKIKKIIYLFMDIHQNVDEQSQCDEFKGIDVSNYIANNIRTATKPLDILLEIVKSGINYEDEYKHKYIREMRRLFSHEFNKQNNKVLSAKSNKLVRLHYLDIRDIHGYHIFDLLEQVNDILQESVCNEYIGTNDFTNLYDFIDEIFNNLVIFEKDIFGKSKNVSSEIIKIKSKYNHKDVQKKISTIFKTIQKMIDTSKKIIGEILTKLEKNKELLENKDKLTLIKEPIKEYTYYQPTTDIIYYISTKFGNLYSILLLVFVLFTDIYFLRRFLDKDYIKNAIVYTGSRHSINYIYFLKKFYNFKITNVSYSLYKDITKLNQELGKIDDFDDIYKIEKLLYPEKLKQCSNLTDFPKNFE